MDLTPYPEIIVLQLIPFLVLILALNTLIFKPMLDYLEERRRRMFDVSQSANELDAKINLKMAEIDKRWATAKAEILDVRNKIIQESLKEERKILDEAHAQVDAKVEKFRAELVESQKEARSNLKKDVDALSYDIASRFIKKVNY